MKLRIIFVVVIGLLAAALGFRGTVQINWNTQIKGRPTFDAIADCGLIVNDSSSAAANVTAISTCITGLPAAGGEIFFPPGNFYFNSGILIQKNNVTLRGSGAGSAGLGGSGAAGTATVLKYTGSSGAGTYLIKFNGTTLTGSTIYNPGLRDLALEANSLARSALILFDAEGGAISGVYMHNWSGGYGIILDGDGAANSCGFGGGSTFFDAINMVSYLAGSGGIVFGPTISGLSNDVCSYKFGRIFIDCDNSSGVHGLSFVRSDSNTFDSVSVGGNPASAIAVSGIHVASGVVTANVPSHGIQNGSPDGVYILNACDVNAGSTECVTAGGRNLALLNGTHLATWVDSSHVTLDVVGVADGDYFAYQMYGASIEFNNGISSNNVIKYALALTGIHIMGNSNNNIVTGWNFREKANAFSNDAATMYVTPGGINAYGQGLSGLAVDGTPYGTLPILSAVHTTTVTSLTSSTWAPILWDTIDKDHGPVKCPAGASFCTPNTDFIVPMEGFYSAIGNVMFTGNVTGTRAVRVEANSTCSLSGGQQIFYAEVPPATAGNMSIPVSGGRYLFRGDVVRVCGYQSSGGSLNTVASESNFALVRH